MADSGFRFGLEGEYLLVDAGSYRPLWHPELNFRRLSGILEAIPFEEFLEGLSLQGLELDAPHRRVIPYQVEGYGMPGAEMTAWVDMRPKGVEIRTPVCPSIDRCVSVYEDLYQGMQSALQEHGYRAAALAHHPTAWEFHGPQNHPRHDWWQWGMRAMTTYGPDINLSLPERLRSRLDVECLHRRVNHYAPAMAAFSLASPVACGGLWRIGGRNGLSVRTHRRSASAPSFAAHPKEQGRLEFKAFDMPVDRRDFGSFLLLWLWLVLDADAPGGLADEAQRVEDLVAVAGLGWDAPGVVERAEEMLDRADAVLPAWNFDPAPLRRLRRRLEDRWTPAEAIIEQMTATPGVEALLRFLDETADACVCEA